MTPFHFGSSERRLFGIYDPPRGETRGLRAAVLCHPSGNEHVHAYRTMRLLADRLSQSGFHVLRFDYYGTGDSGGDSHEADAAHYHSDALTAITELKDMSGAGTVSLIGLRLGANVAAEAAAANGHVVDSLVLWDPIAGMLDVSRHVGRLPRRSLVVLTASEAAEPAVMLPALGVVRLDGALAWAEERITAGNVPAEVIRHIDEWLR